MFPRFSPVADHAVLVEFADRIEDAAHEAVRALDAALTASPPIGLAEVIPAYVSLLVEFDPLVTDHAAMTAHLRAQMATPRTAPAGARVHQVAVCYDGDLGRDLQAVATAKGVSTDAVIAAHLAGRYSVAMYGFAPGYAYLAGTPPDIQLDRKPSPVRGVAAGSVLVAGPQCLVSTLTMPTGWWIIGASPTRILNLTGDRPFLFDVGDQVQFYRIDRAAFDAAGGRP